MSHASRRLVLPAVIVMLVSVLTASLLLGIQTADAASYKAPSSFKATATSQTSVRLTWKAVSKATLYRIKYDDNSTMKSPAWAKSSSTSVELKGLKPNTKYWVNVVVVNSKDKVLSKYSKTITFKTRPKGSFTQLPPTSVKATSIAATALRLSWPAVAGATRYRVKYSTSSKLSSPKYAYSSGTSVEFSRLKANTTYYVQVSTINAKSSNLSQFSTTLKVKTRAKSSYSQLSPTGLKVSGITAGSGALSWAARGGNKYRLRYSTSSSFSKATWVTLSGTTRTLTGLKPSTRYYVQVRAVDTKDKDTSEYSPTVSFTTSRLVLTAPPSDLRVVGATPTSLTLQWTGIPGAPGYRVKYDTQPWASSEYAFTTSNTVTLTGLLTNTAYSLKLRVMEPGGDFLTDYGATVKATTPVTSSNGPGTGPVKIPDTPPTGLSVSVSGTSATLKWTAIAGAPQYRVKYDVNPWNSSLYGTSSTNSLTINRLSPGMTYSFKVRVMDASGNFLTDYGATVKASIAQQPTSVVAAAYNIRCHNCSSGIAEEKPWTTRRTAIVDAIWAENPDVVGLQEAQQSWLIDSKGKTINKSQFEDLVERLGGTWALTNSARNNCVKSTTPTGCVYKDQGASKGTKIIYRTDRLKLVSSGTVQLSKLKSSSYERYLAWAVFEQRSTGKRFFFGDTHLEPDNDKAGQTVFHDQRAKQARDVLAAIAAKNTAKLPVVLVGDLASSRADEPTNAPYDVITKGGLVDPLGNVKGVSQPVKPTVETRINTNYYSFNGWARKARKTTAQVNGVYTDYILTSPGMRVEEFENVVKVDTAGNFVGVIPSDHNMLSATLWLPGVTPEN